MPIIVTFTGYNSDINVGELPRTAAEIPLETPSRAGLAFGRQNLIDWIDEIAWPY